MDKFKTEYYYNRTEYKAVDISTARGLKQAEYYHARSSKYKYLGQHEYYKNIAIFKILRGV